MFEVYKRTKLAEAMFAKDLSEKLKGMPLLSLAIHENPEFENIPRVRGLR